MKMPNLQAPGAGAPSAGPAMVRGRNSTAQCRDVTDRLSIANIRARIRGSLLNEISRSLKVACGMRGRATVLCEHV